MIIYRSMSEQEFVDFCHGVEIQGRCYLDKRHNSYAMHKGICFFLSANNACQWAKPDSIIAAFRVKNSEHFEKGCGRYYNPLDEGYIHIEEVACSSYSQETVELLGYGYEPVEYCIPKTMEFYLTPSGDGVLTKQQKIYNYFFNH